MKLLLQRVARASVTVDDTITGKIDNGLLVFLGVAPDDTPEILTKMMQKMLKLRIFSDENGKINRSVCDVNGAVLIVSQFTLYADCRHGNRPNFIKAAPPAHAESLYNLALDFCKTVPELRDVQAGIFGADMRVSLENDGPFSVLLDSAEFC